MNLRDLKYLVALADHKHFGRAAAACFVSQPTLSTQIKKLEDELGVPLVERAPRKVMLTPAGREAASRARGIVAEVEQMKEAARRSQDPEAGTVRLGIFPTLGPYLLPHVVPRIRERFPQLELLLIEEKSDQLLRQLREGRLDAAVLALPIHDDQLHTEFLFEEPFVLAVPGSHPLAHRTSLTLDELSDLRLLLLEDGHCLRDQALDVCHLAGALEKSEFQATSLETLRQMVAANVGVTLLPLLAVKPPVARSENVQLIGFDAERPPSRRIGMVWRRSSAMGDFLEQLAKLFQQLPPHLLHLEGSLTGNRNTAATARERVTDAIATTADSE
ncbi:MAG TPA: LysR substrate-binding domain-containing protein [Stenotrophomonas sp.]|jgi:LysR family hydrogen peroxide-inducible transcriptional activator